MRRTKIGAVLAAVLTLAVACASGGEIAEAPTTEQPTRPTAVAPTVVSTIPVATVQPTTTSSSTSTSLPGSAIDPMFTPAGAELAAVGVPFDDPLVLRALPGDGQPALVTMTPLAAGIMSTGRARSLGVRSAWLEVTVDGNEGWLPLRNLLYLGGAQDATERFVGLIGRVPIAASMLELGRLVGESIAATDFEVPTRIVVVTEPFEGAVGEITVDVLDFPDDSVGGQRLRISGRALLDTEMTGSGTAGYELVSVEATPLCIRGAADDGLCP